MRDVLHNVCYQYSIVCKLFYFLLEGHYIIICAQSLCRAGPSQYLTSPSPFASPDPNPSSSEVSIEVFRRTDVGLRTAATFTVILDGQSPELPGMVQPVYTDKLRIAIHNLNYWYNLQYQTVIFFSTCFNFTNDMT